VIEYYDRLNSITILGEVFGQQQRKRLIRVVVPGPDGLAAKQRELAGLDDADICYLNEKGVHDLPLRKVWYIPLKSLPAPSPATSWARR